MVDTGGGGRTKAEDEVRAVAYEATTTPAHTSNAVRFHIVYCLLLLVRHCLLRRT